MHGETIKVTNLYYLNCPCIRLASKLIILFIFFLALLPVFTWKDDSDVLRTSVSLLNK